MFFEFSFANCRSFSSFTWSVCDTIFSFNSFNVYLLNIPLTLHMQLLILSSRCIEFSHDMMILIFGSFSRKPWKNSLNIVGSLQLSKTIRQHKSFKIRSNAQYIFPQSENSLLSSLSSKLSISEIKIFKFRDIFLSKLTIVLQFFNDKYNTPSVMYALSYSRFDIVLTMADLPMPAGPSTETNLFLFSSSIMFFQSRFLPKRCWTLAGKFLTSGVFLSHYTLPLLSISASVGQSSCLWSVSILNFLSYPILDLFLPWIMTADFTHLYVLHTL